jgi:hypothetical protein
MHLPINVKSSNNISKWQMGFNSAFKGLMMILFIWTQEMFFLCSGEVMLSTRHFIALETMLTRVVAILGSCSISVLVCPVVLLALISVGLAGCNRARNVASPTSLYRSSIQVSV